MYNFVIYPLMLLFSLTPKIKAAANDEEIRYYEDLITTAQQEGAAFELPTNNHQYAAQNGPTNFGDEFDYIIIGAGSAGTVIANRLSANPSLTILLIEAGAFGNNLTDIPNMMQAATFSPYNWGYKSVPQKTACLGMVDQRCPMPRGKGVGGTTLINGLIYSRGSALDFDQWEALGNPGWGYKDVIESFKNAEHFDWNDPESPVDPSAHGFAGDLNVEFHQPRSAQLEGFLTANQECGYKIADYNSGTGLGVSASQLNTRNGTRCDGGKAFIRNILSRDNLRVLTHSYVTKILINGTKAYGVAFNRNGEKFEVRAQREVILCAGAINSPQILMLSGIGPKAHLEELGIPVVQDLEVGSALRDHPTFFGLSFVTNYKEPVTTLKENIAMWLDGRGPLAVGGNHHAVGFYESRFSTGSGRPDIEMMLFPPNTVSNLGQRNFAYTDQTVQDVWGGINVTNTMIVTITALHPESYGTIRLQSKDPLDFPLIDPNFLSDKQNKDIETLYEGVQIAMNFMQSPSMKSMGACLQGGGLKACAHETYLSKEYWCCALRQVTMHLYHPVGTCPMGPDPDHGAVVDAQLRVYGVENLRVADASIFPTTLSGHPNAPTVMVGEKLADMILEGESISSRCD